MKNKHQHIKIDRLALGGDAVGHLNEANSQSKKAIFVPYALPDEIVEAAAETHKNTFSRYHLHSVVSASPDRVDPPCPYHFKPQMKARACGGCQWQQMSIERQRVAKRELVFETLSRLGGIKSPPVQDVLCGGDPWRYRNKVQIPFGIKNKQPVSGFYARGSHDIVEFDDCLTQSELSVKIFKSVQKYASSHKWVPYIKDKNQGWLRHLLIRTNRAGQALVAVVSKDARFPDRKGFVKEMRKAHPSIIALYQNVHAQRTNVVLGRQWIHLWGKKNLREKICGLNITFAPDAFMQVNTDVAERLYERAISLLGVQKNMVVFDLYCGVGVMALVCAKKAKFVVGVDEVPASIKNATENAKNNRVGNARFLAQRTERFLMSQTFNDMTAQEKNVGVILDPPRSGCHPDVISAILKVRPPKIVYVSCDPATLARDLKMLLRSYRLKTVIPVDLFPQTAHIETISQLELK